MSIRSTSIDPESHWHQVYITPTTIQNVIQDPVFLCFSKFDLVNSNHLLMISLSAKTGWERPFHDQGVLWKQGVRNGANFIVSGGPSSVYTRSSLNLLVWKSSDTQEADSFSFKQLVALKLTILTTGVVLFCVCIYVSVSSMCGDCLTATSGSSTTSPMLLSARNYLPKMLYMAPFPQKHVKGQKGNI